jgi:phage terminase large subunit-like protein
LVAGRKWEETQIEINHKVFNHTTWVLAAGITGSLRGINFDDFRPDLIIIDDPQTDEMAATLEQRTKVADLILGAVKNSLAPASEEPNAKLAMAITPQHPEDISQQALGDEQWTSRVFPCWTKETLDFPVDQQKSSWEEQFPTPTLRADKKAALQRNKLSIFAREMECRLISSEIAQFRPNWLSVREPNSVPRGCFAVLGIDPVPPPSDRQMAKGLQGKDWEAQYVWGRYQGNYHLLDFARNRGHEPSWSVATALGLAHRWRIARIVVDSVAYQRTLKWFLEQEMKRRGIYYSVIPLDDKMAKFARITNVLSGLASAGKLWIGPEHTIFAEQFNSYGPVYSGIDDDLDASAMALQDLSNPYLDRIGGGEEVEFQEVEEFPFIGACP